MRRVVLAAALVAFINVTPAAAHSWYDSDCCSGQDCFPAAQANNEDAVKEVPGGRMVTLENGATVFVENKWIKANPAKHRPSGDRKIHVCAVDLCRTGDEYGGPSSSCPADKTPPLTDPNRWTVRCVYEPFNQ